ncbi:MAG: pyridoxal-phosphate dependent enzyme [Alphaproteobacteria bacterium]|nr:pyridoxal-phosphate dependent enzyme [Alphaproteobacteria bacterium]
MALPPPVIEKHEGFTVIRDDALSGGTKRRVLNDYLGTLEADEFVYPSTPYGMGPVAIAYACRDLGKQATLFYPQRKRERFTEQMETVLKLGAKIELVPHGYMSVVKARTREYAEKTDAHLLPLGLAIPEVQNALTKIAKDLPVLPKQVWCATGTGTLTRALQAAWPKAEHHAVLVAMEPTASLGTAITHKAAEDFAQSARILPPYNSLPQYDAKVWQFVSTQGRKGALIWNVA